MGYRVEKDSMGELRVPADALYGASTQRAVENFPISGLRFSRRFIRALGLIKGSAARVSGETGYVPREIASAVARASDEVMEGGLDHQFVLDIFQTGSGTSTNTNANEVIANRATQLLGGAIGDRLVHPNDHVNFGQSSNDVDTHRHPRGGIGRHPGRPDTRPSPLCPGSLRGQGGCGFVDVVKSGRTHLMDATPVTLGQEFSGYADQARRGAERLQGRGTRPRRAPAGWYRGWNRDQRACRIRRRGHSIVIGTGQAYPSGRPPTTSRPRLPRTQW